MVKRKIRTIISLIGIGFIFVFFTIIYFKKHQELARKEIAELEKGWYEKIPSDEIRKTILDILAKAEKGQEVYNKYRASFKMVADVFDYKKDLKYDDALAAAYFSYCVDSNKVTYNVLEQIRHNTIMPYFAKEYGNKNQGKLFNYEKQITKVIPAKGGDYFIVFSDKSLRHCRIKDPLKYYDFSPFFNSDNWRNYFSGSNDVKLCVVDNLEGKVRYLFYDKISIFLYNPWTETWQPYNNKDRLNNDIVEIIAFSGSKFKVFFRNGEYENYLIEGNELRFVNKGSYHKAKLNYYETLNAFSNSNFYRIINDYDNDPRTTIYNLNSPDSIIPNYDVLDINENGVSLIQQGTQLKVRSKANMVAKDLKGGMPAVLSAKSNVVVTSDYTNAFITYFNLDEAGNVNIEHIDSVPDLPKSFIPSLSTGSNFVLFKRKGDENFLVYDIEKGQERYLFVPPGYKSTFELNFNPYKTCFLADTTLIVYSSNTTYIYNISSLQMAGLKDFEVNHKITLFTDILNSGFYFRHQKEISEIAFKTQDTLIIKNLINSLFDKGEYNSAIEYSQKFCYIVRSKDNKLFAYKIISKSYENLRRNLTYEVNSASRQLIYAKQVFDYKRKIDSVRSDSNTKKDLSLARGSLSWYLILNGRYLDALQEAKKALENKSGGIEWITTNLALSYYLNGKKQEAYSLYKEWRNKQFDKLDSARTLFMNDINTLEKNYKVRIPDKETIFKILKAK